VTTALATAERLDFSIRSARENELRFVQSTWSRCAKLPARSPYDMVALGGSQAALWLDPKIVYRMHHRIVDELLPQSSVAVAVLRRMPDDPIGFAVWSGQVLHYVYVAPDSRRAHVGRQLALHTRCSTASHVTPEGARLLRCLSGYAS